jgi:hypothetical protein
VIETIALIIFILSFGGILFILARKMPILVKLPQNGTTGIKEHRIFLTIEDRIKNIFAKFEKQIIMHKILSFAKVVILKAETKIDHLLHAIRRKAKEQKEKDLKK